MSERPARAALGPMVLLLGGALLLAFALLLDPLRGKPFDLSLHQCVALLLGAVLAAEGTLALGGRPQPALWSLLTAGDRAATIASFALAAAVGAVLLYLFRAYAADDAFITFRYARNLARGLGVVWNPGEPPVEGYSNFLWMVKAASAIRLGLDPLPAMRALAIVCYAASLVAVRALALRAGASARHANLAPVAFAAIPAFAYWTVSGLETISVVLLSLLYLLALTIERDHAWPWRSALAGDLLVLSRPDTPLLIMVAVLPLLAPFDRARRAWLGRLILLAAPIAALYLGWKVITFHRVFANTVAAKLHLLAGLSLVTGFFAFAFPLVAALVASLAARGRPPGRTLALQVLLLAAAFAFALLHTASPVGHYYRFFLPVLAAMVATVPLLLDRWEAPAPAGRTLAAAIAALAVLYTLSPLYDMVEYANAEARGLARAHVTIGRWLAGSYRPDQLLAASDCGVMPFLSGMRTIDIWGLTDRRIAERGFDAGYVMRAKPDVIVLHSLHPDAFMGRDPYDRGLHDAIAGDRSYRLQGRYEFVNYWLWVYTRVPPG